MSNAVVAPARRGPEFTRAGLNLADASLGARVLFVTDEFFAPRERMLDPAPPVFYPDRYDDHGKWMDGWETRRRRSTGHDECVIRLAMPGRLMGVDFDTSFFTGNYPPAVSLDACYCPGGDPGDDADWQTLVPATPLQGNDHGFREIRSDQPWSHLAPASVSRRWPGPPAGIRQAPLRLVRAAGAGRGGPAGPGPWR